MGIWVISFVGFAVLYGSLMSVAMVVAGRALGLLPDWRIFPLCAVTLSFVFLTQHPLPDPDTLVCPWPSATPQLQPMFYLEAIRQLLRSDAGWLAYLSNRALVATAMNFLICLIIGVLLARHRSRLRHAILLGALLTLLVETTQLTGLWGLYPCAYRQFDVDDLILNALGVCAGWILMNFWRGKTV